MKKIIPYMVVAMLCLNFEAGAQEKLKGRVVDAQSQEPLAGAIIKIAKPAQTVITNSEGYFELNLPKGSYELQIQYLSYGARSQSLTLPFTGNLIINLTANENTLQEVEINAGYYTVKEKLLTGNITKVSAATIAHHPVSNPLIALQGRVPGLYITQTSGVAGASFNVQIRGQSALDLTLSKNSPLFIIDGVPFEQGNNPTNKLTTAANLGSEGGGLSPLNMINPQEIAHIEVLKDADATAIYGSRGANGVILITTKKGNGGLTKFSIDNYVGVSKLGRTMAMLNTETFLMMRREAFANDGVSITGANAPDVVLWDNNRYTDFKKELIGHTANDNRWQLGINGGNEQTSFRIGASYFRQSSVFSNQLQNVVGAINASIGHVGFNKKLKLQLSASYANDKNELPVTDLSRYINLPPNLRIYNADGTYAWADGGVVYNTLGSDIVNPFALKEELFSGRSANLMANANLSYKPVKALILGLNMGYNELRTDEYSAKPMTAIDPNLTALFGILPSASFSNSALNNYILEPTASYFLTMGRHQITMLAGAVWQQKKYKLNYQYGSNYSSDLLLGTIAAAGTVDANNDESLYRYSAAFARLNYNYADKYIVNFTARRDGSSRFGNHKRMANFAAIGGAWLFANQESIRRLFPWLSTGKVRMSYGLAGNDQIGEYKYLNLWSSTTNTYDGLSGLYPRTLANANYNWEKIRKLEVGLDIGFLKDRLSIATAYYRHRSSNQLINNTLPATTGFTQVVMNFPALVQNSGFEMMMSGQIIKAAKWKWHSTFNISLNRNKLLSFPNIESSSYKNTYIVGKSLNLLKGLHYLGVDSQTGVYKFEDTNGDGLLNSADYRYLGERSPRYTGGLQQQLSYGNIALNFFFQFTKQLGLSYVQQLSSSAPGRIYNQPQIVLDRWQQAGDSAPIQKFTAQTGVATAALSYLRQSDGAYMDASFIKLRNVDLSYTFKALKIGAANITGLKLYVQGQNLLTFTGYKGSDPETQNFFKLPPLKTWVAGLHLNF